MQKKRKASKSKPHISREKSACVYILACENGHFYTGATIDLWQRIALHKRGRGARYTRSFPPQALVYHEDFPNLSQAYLRERQIKTLTHQEKSDLLKKAAQKTIYLSNSSS